MKILKEDLGFITIPAFLLAVYLLKKINKEVKADLDREQPAPNDNVIDAMNDIWNDKEFVKAFSKIINDVGDYNEILKKLNKDISYGMEDSQRWFELHSKDFKPNLNVSKILTKLEATPQYKKMAKKFKFTKEDGEFFRKLMYVIITRENINKVAQDILKKSAVSGLENPKVIKTQDLRHSWEYGDT